MSKPRCFRFRFPPGCDATEVIIRELRAQDELDAAVLADASLTNDQRRIASVVMQAERRESIKLSIVAIDGRRVNVAGEPAAEVDEWSQKSGTALNAFYLKVNGVPEELGKSLEEAQPVDLDTLQPPPAPPVAGTGK